MTFFSQGVVYDDLEEFKEFIEEKNEPYDYYIEGLTLSLVSWDNEFIDDDYFDDIYPEQLLDADDNVLLEYYHYNQNVRQINFNPETMEVTVYTDEEWCHSETMLRGILTMTLTLEFLVIFIVYFIRFKRKRKADKKDVYHTAKV